VQSHAPQFLSASAGYASLTQLKRLKRLHRLPPLHLISRCRSLPSHPMFPRAYVYAAEDDAELFPAPPPLDRVSNLSTTDGSYGES
jgi:hypothetical protein